MKTAIYRREHFNSAHRLHNPNWSIEKNKEIFGKCNNEDYHGHNYDLEVCIVGQVDEETGYLIDTKLLSNIINKQIIDPFDHKNLNTQVDEFKSLNPTTENLARVIYERLITKIPTGLELKIKLYETRKNYAEYPVL
ncbi:MAG: 6-carboxytetrahydropterin synthase [Vicingaceae bacterium]|nr:6-carboxytetrahydropterin synthase [Vicingaceae bacterium]